MPTSPFDQAMRKMKHTKEAKYLRERRERRDMAVARETYRSRDLHPFALIRR
jgi:hypothetical protein